MSLATQRLLPKLSYNLEIHVSYGGVRKFERMKLSGKEEKDMTMAPHTSQTLKRYLANVYISLDSGIEMSDSYSDWSRLDRRACIWRSSMAPEVPGRRYYYYLYLGLPPDVRCPQYSILIASHSS